jgi:ABC-2 type transport system permease protein
VGVLVRAARQRDPRDAGLARGHLGGQVRPARAFQNFIVVPLTFLSGVFYSIHSLPPFWQALSHANPFFYMIDGFRYGFFGVLRHLAVASFGIVAAAAVALAIATLSLLARGWKLRN